MNGPPYNKLTCQICAWFGGTTDATHVCLTKSGGKWYVCQFHADSNTTNLDHKRPLDDMDRSEAYDLKTQELTTRWIQQRKRSVR